MSAPIGARRRGRSATQAGPSSTAAGAGGDDGDRCRCQPQCWRFTSHDAPEVVADVVQDVGRVEVLIQSTVTGRGRGPVKLKVQQSSTGPRPERGPPPGSTTRVSAAAATNGAATRPRTPRRPRPAAPGWAAWRPPSPGTPGRDGRPPRRPSAAASANTTHAAAGTSLIGCTMKKSTTGLRGHERGSHEPGRARMQPASQEEAAEHQRGAHQRRGRVSAEFAEGGAGQRHDHRKAEWVGGHDVALGHAGPKAQRREVPSAGIPPNVFTSGSTRTRLPVSSSLDVLT